MGALNGLVNIDNSYEGGFRGSNAGVNFQGNLGWVALVERQMAAFGLTRGTETGQQNWNLPFCSSSVNPGGTNGSYAAFDGSTTVGWTALYVPSSGNPASLWYDAGADITNTLPVQPIVTNYKIYFANTTADPAAWTVAGSNDGVAWTTLDTQTAQTAGGAAAYKAYAFNNATGYRYYRLAVTATTGAANLVVIEWQLFTGASGTNQVAAPVTLHPTGTSTFSGYSIWKFADALQASSPVVIKIGYGSGNTSYTGGGNASGYGAALQITVGTTTNGTLAFTGNNYQATIGPVANNTYANGAKFACSGSTNRVAFALGYSTPGLPMLFFIERTHDASGNDTADGFSGVFQGTVSQRSQFTYPFTGTAPAAETDFALLTPLNNTGLRGLNVSIFANYPVMGTTSIPVIMNPMISHWGYFNGDITAETQFTANMYGANHNFFPLGNSVTAFSRGGLAGASCAMLFE